MSRFRDVQTLMTRSLQLQTSPTTLLLAERGFDSTGDRQTALTYYQQALPICRDSGDRAGEAASLGNIGTVSRQPR